MARIDRRVSPNQTALWTVYELVTMQARRVAVSSTCQYRSSRWMRLGEAIVTMVGAVMAKLGQMSRYTAPRLATRTTLTMSRSSWMV